MGPGPNQVTVNPGIVLDNDLTQLTSGISEGDAVIIQGTDRLQDGSQVRPAKADGSTPPGGGRGRGGRGRGDKGGGNGGGDKGGGGPRAGGKSQ